MKSTPTLARLEASPPGHFARSGAAVTERRGGASLAPYESLNLGRSVSDDPERVTENERRALASLRLEDRVARLRLEHGAQILVVREPGLHGPADALMTSDSSLVLWLTVADCYPVALEAGEWRALAHCGWRGAAAGLAEATVAALSRASELPPTEIRAWIGPGIGACCYEVGPEVTAEFSARAFAADPASGRARLDLRSDLRSRLRESGLPDAAIVASSACTSCERERFFSHRRDGFPCGRMAAIVWAHQRDAAPSTSS